MKLVEISDGVLVAEADLKKACKKLGIKDKKLTTKISKTEEIPKSMTPKTVKRASVVTKPRTLKKKLKIVSQIDVKNPEVKKEEMQKPHRYNEQFIDILGQLASLMMQLGEPFRARAYSKAMESIMNYPEDITSLSQIGKLPGVGTTIVAKLKEYVETGKLNKLEKEKANPIIVLTGVYGIGPKKAQDLIKDGITTIDALREKQESVLNDVQKIGLRYYEDILSRIPRSEIDNYRDVLTAIFEKSTVSGSRFEIVGSYRRGAISSGDIDMIITNDKNDKSGSFDAFLDTLIEDGIVTHVLSRGASKSLTIAHLDESGKSRRLDFLYANPSEYPFAILYFTGSKIFNTVMRQRALDMGLTLNEHGLYKLVAGKKGSKVEHEFPSEESIFDFLGIKYKTPEERKDGRAVQLVSDALPKVVKTKKKITVSRTLKKKEEPTANLYLQFKERGISVLAGKESETAELLREASKAYYNDSPFMSDAHFDLIKEFMEEKYPSNPVLAEIGAPVEAGTRNKVNLPFNMPSMDKIKPDTGALKKWKVKFPGTNGYVISKKLDGVSGMYVKRNGEQAKLYTRGNGKVGQDISHIIPFLRIPELPTNMSEIVVRGEFLIPKDRFNKKYAASFSNARNLVAGIINSVKKTSAQKYKDLDFVAYEVIVPDLTPFEQMQTLTEVGFNTVTNEIIEAKELTNDYLSALLVEWRETSNYEIDGVIVTENDIHPRGSGNPEHAFAFKMVLSDQVAEAKVRQVLWAPSKDGVLKPRIQIEPVVLGGAKIEFATAHNARFVEDNKLGVGAIVEIIRSGDVIPKIERIIVPAEKAQMPDVPYEWNATHVDIKLIDAENNEIVREKNILTFFKTLGVDGIGAGNVRKLIDAGFDSVAKVLAMSESDFLTLEGFKKRMAEKIYTNISEGVAKSTLPALMAASNVFGRGLGTSRFLPVLEAFPDILTSKASAEDKKTKLLTIKGMGKIMINGLVDNIPAFIKFMKEAGLEDRLDFKPDTPTGDVNHAVFGREVIMTGFRDKALIKSIEEKGGKLGSSVKSDTLAVLVKDKDEDTGKAEQAKKKGVPIMTIEEFKNKFEL